MDRGSIPLASTIMAALLFSKAAIICSYTGLSQSESDAGECVMLYVFLFLLVAVPSAIVVYRVLVD